MPGSEISGVDGLGLGIHEWNESTPVYVLDHICLGFHFICAAGKGVKCLGGYRRGLREICVIDSSVGVSMTSDGGVVIAQFYLAFAENSSEVAVS